MSSFLDFAMVSLHLTALTLAGQMLQIPCLERPTTPILHRPRINAVYFSPRYHISEPLNQHIARINQNSSCLVSMRSGLLWVMIAHNGLRRVITGDEWWRVTTGENRWRRVRTGSNALRRAITGDNEWSRVITADDGVRQVTIGGNGIWTDDNEWRLSTSTTFFFF